MKKYNKMLLVFGLLLTFSLVSFATPRKITPDIYYNFKATLSANQFHVPGELMPLVYHNPPRTSSYFNISISRKGNKTYKGTATSKLQNVAHGQFILHAPQFDSYNYSPIKVVRILFHLNVNSAIKGYKDFFTQDVYIDDSCMQIGTQLIKRTGNSITMLGRYSYSYDLKDKRIPQEVNITLSQQQQDNSSAGDSNPYAFTLSCQTVPR